MSACPCCDVGDGLTGPVEALAIGVALGQAFEDMHSVTELMCQSHRTPYVMAMLKAAVRTNAVEGESAQTGGKDGVR